MVRCGPNRTRDKDFHVFPNVVTRAKRGRINSEIAYGAARVERSEVIRFQSFVFEVASDAPDHFIDGRSAEVVECCLGIKDDDEQVGNRLSWAIVRELDFHGRAPRYGTLAEAANDLVRSLGQAHSAAREEGI